MIMRKHITKPLELILPAEMDFSEEHAQRLMAAFMAQAAARPVKARYAAAIEGSTTEHDLLAMTDNKLKGSN